MTITQASKYRQSLVDQGCRIKVSCTPRERKWRVMVWTNYKTCKDDDRISHFKGWQGNGPDMPVGDDVTIANSKGYDKWSFRNDKSQKKRKLRKKKNV